MTKLAKTTIKSLETYNHSCSSKDTSLFGRIDPYLSKFTGKDVYPMEWPGGGEVDILEQTNFSNTNLISIHGGPNCQVTTPLTDTPFANKSLYGDGYNLLRSVCGGKVCKDSFIENGNGFPFPYKPSCPQNSQINVPNAFGEYFNLKKGGVFATQWIPKEKIYIWFYPRNLFNQEYLEQNNGPLSKNPIPEKWSVEELSPISNQYYRTLVASYILNDKNAITDSCDLNFQSIIINITLGGGWGGAVMPKYCNVNNNSEVNDYVNNCYNADPDDANNNNDGGYVPINKIGGGCYDGSRSENFRGKDSKALFYSEAYFKINKIKVFQNPKTDDFVW